MTTDCSTCLHGQACCRQFKVPVTVEEGVSEWFALSPDRSFMIHLRRRQDGSCLYLGENGACTAYEWRPETCVEYDCAGDPRIGGQQHDNS